MSVSQEELAQAFAERFGGKPTLLVTSPGRTEIAGNHTDHEGGHVIAAAVDRAVHGLAAPNGLEYVRLLSLGFGKVEVVLADLSPRDDERGFVPMGFDLA